MASKDDIPSDLTLELGEDFTPDKFMAAARAFFGYVEECARMVAPTDGKTPDWTVAVREGSALLAVVPNRATPLEVLAPIYIKAATGARALARGSIDDSGLSEPAIKHLKTLSELTEVKHKVPKVVRLWVRREPIIVGPDIARVVKEDWRADYKDYGTIEGRLRTIQEAGSLQFMIRDEQIGQTVRGYFPEDMLQRAFDNFRRRVEVSGVIHYRRNGTPISIDATDIEALPEDSDLPTAADVRGLLRAS
jgi:hypothetical protein